VEVEANARDREVATVGRGGLSTADFENEFATMDQ
jgi:hypothetical protein